MPSPFPGMDPYLETPDIWPDFLDRLAGEISIVLNHTLPRPYYARLEMRPEVGIVGDEPSRRIVPDVAVVKPRVPASRHAGVAVLDEPRADVSPSVRMKVPNEPLRHHFVEIRDVSRGHALVTLIEIVSPTNKRPGPDRRAYEAKQQEILSSDTSLIELDLLRGGEPLVGGPAIVELTSQLEPRPDYVIAVDRAWLRGAELDFELFPVRLEDSLPCIPVPLRKGEAEVPLDIQYVFRRAYDGGPYARGAVDYGAAPDPPLRPDLAAWLADCLNGWTQ
ncbi:MAG: DUF4058 family protein [Planctomycetaceae bacterium]|nr:DUF4058 family protein [Planctomycetaceae bacterium]